MIKKNLEKYFHNKNIGIVHWVVFLDVLFGIIVIFIHTEPSDLLMDFAYASMLVILFPIAFRTDKSNKVLKLAAAGIAYANIFIALNDYFGNKMSDAVNTIFIIPAAILGVGIYIPIIKKYFFKK